MDSEVNQTISLLTETTQTIQTIQNTIDNICAQHKDELIGAHDYCLVDSQQQAQENAHLESIDSNEKVLNTEQLPKPQNIQPGIRKKLKIDNQNINSQNNIQVISEETDQEITDSLPQKQSILKKTTQYKQISIESSLKGNKDQIVNEVQCKKKSKAQVKARIKVGQKQITQFFISNKEQIPLQSSEVNIKEEKPLSDIRTENLKKRKNISQQPSSQQETGTEIMELQAEDNDDFLPQNQSQKGREMLEVVLENEENDNRINSELGNGVFENKQILKLASWNINGIEKILQKEKLIDYMKQGEQDIICLNETKVCEKNFKKLKVFSQIESVGYEQYWSFNSENNGQFGVGILSKAKPIRAIEGIGESEFENQGRVLALEFDKFIILNVYFPFCGVQSTKKEDISYSKEKKKEFKKKFNSFFSSFVNPLNDRNPNKPVIICGDFNYAYMSIDGGTSTVQAKLSTKTENKQFYELMKQGWVDCFRFKDFDREQKISPGAQKFSGKNIQNQIRFDYFLMHENFIHQCKASKVNQNIFGSYHFPIELLLNLTSEKNENDSSLLKIQEIREKFESNINNVQNKSISDPDQGKSLLLKKKKKRINFI